MTERLFVTCSSGLEPLLVQELQEFQLEEISSGFRGVYVNASPEAIYKINYCSRIAGRVLLPIKQFRCRDARGLYQAAYGIDWRRYIPKDSTIAIDSNVQHRELRNSLFAAQVVKDAICDQLRERTGARPSVDTKNPDIQLNLFIQREQASLSVDTSGTPLHKRGYRQESVEAPLKENLAAALFRLAQFTGQEIFCDPCCGSGTLLIEGALIATQTPPGFLRKRWGFMSLPNFSPDLWLKIKNEADSKRVPLKKNQIFGFDINKNAVHVSKVNLRATGFHQQIEVLQQDFRHFEPQVKPNFIMTNPPHGLRLGEVELLRNLYRDLGDFCKEQMAHPGRSFIFTGSLELSKEIGLATKQRYPIDNGGIDSRLLEFDIF